ncbi:hypothetical protein I79_026129 [Cricetulus griseus]|uniref:Uncharacterized protein n=1 Tax=Cricetulus griseus TaxID=10029 RepID=G3IQ40_CRIGR|nr:hypothetical protein I79_026129 [Cricetulus griseus]
MALFQYTVYQKVFIPIKITEIVLLVVYCGQKSWGSSVGTPAGSIQLSSHT